MDDIVKQAMAKWPNVPHCYGWLSLDARGHWRMQGERLYHAALIAFINRNYCMDERGCCYFQNGPQRVYVALETAPYVARTTPQGYVLHTGETFAPTAAWMTEAGELLLQGDGKLAQLDDRDVVQLLAQLTLDGAPVADDALLAWLGKPAGQLALGTLAVQPLREDPALRFGFEPLPHAEMGSPHSQG